MDNKRKSYTKSTAPIRRYKQKSQVASLRTGLVVIMSVFVILGAVVYIMSLTGTGLYRDDSSDVSPIVDSTEESTNNDGTQTEGTTTDEIGTDDPLAVKYTNRDIDAFKIGVGDLVLIDNTHEYKFIDESIKPLWGNSTSSYKLSGSSLSLKEPVILALNKMMDDYVAATSYKHAIVTNAYRSYADQEKLYNQNPRGSAAPGYSDYHSGLTLRLQGYIDENSGIFDLRNSSSAQASWLENNMKNYGFIFRYPSDKNAITGYNIPWQLRYVGVPHSIYIKDNNLCLEEYLELLATNHKYSDEHLKIDTPNGSYEVYYVEGTAEGTIKLPVPSNRDYEISGDNKSGFIVTVLPPRPVTAN